MRRGALCRLAAYANTSLLIDSEVFVNLRRLRGP